MGAFEIGLKEVMLKEGSDNSIEEANTPRVQLDDEVEILAESQARVPLQVSHGEPRHAVTQQ